MSDTREQAGGVPSDDGAIGVGANATLAESTDISQRDDVAKLRKNAIGLGGVLFLTVTGAAPISAMLFNTPISVGFGNGVGTPAGFAFAAIMVPASTLIQRETPPDMLGRVGGTNVSVIFLGQILGLAVSGVLAELVGVRTVFFLCAALSAVMAAGGHLFLQSKK